MQTPRSLKLKKLIQSFHKLERGWEQKELKESLLQELVTQLQELKNSDDPDLVRLSNIASHLKIDSTLKHLSHFLVPIERLAFQTMRDDDFLVRNSDALIKPQYQTRGSLHILCHNWRSAFNVGSCLRTAETLGASHVWLTGYTPTPNDPSVKKTAMGTETYVRWSYEKDPLALIASLKTQRVHSVAFETTAHASSLFTHRFHDDCLFIFGNERFGLDYELLKAADTLVQVPTFGVKNSLNVAVCMGLVSAFWCAQKVQ